MHCFLAHRIIIYYGTERGAVVLCRLFVARARAGTVQPAESQYEVWVAFSCRLVSQEFNADRR